VDDHGPSHDGIRPAQRHHRVHHVDLSHSRGIGQNVAQVAGVTAVRSVARGAVNRFGRVEMFASRVAPVAEDVAEFVNVKAVLAQRQSRDLTKDLQLTRALGEVEDAFDGRISRQVSSARLRIAQPSQRNQKNRQMSNRRGRQLKNE